MPRVHRFGPRYANVMSTIAVFVALGGTSYAVSQLPRNSVGNAQLRRDAVSSEKIRDGAVTKSDLAGDALAAGPRGPRGAEGPAGPRGADGPAGAVGPSEVIQTRRSEPMTIPAIGGGSTTLATLTLGPGSWSIEGQTVIQYIPSTPASEWFDCRLVTATGTELAFAATRVGSDAVGALQTTVPIRTATQLDAQTQVAFTCNHPSAIPSPAPTAFHTVLQAQRVGRIETRAP